MTPGDVRVVFMGSPAFAVPSLSMLAAAGYDLAAVLCQPDRAAGRGGKVQFGPVKSRAVELGIPVFQPETLRDPEVVATVAGFRPDVFVVAAYGKIIPRTVLELPSRGSLNVHASLLPRWRGASPIEAAILAGDESAGISIMEVVPKMDAGPVVSQAAIPIRDDHTGGTLEVELSKLGAGLLVDTLPAWFDRTATVTPQDEARVTYCSLIRKEDGALRTGMTAAEAWRAVRAFNPWPGAYVGLGEERLTIWEAHVEPSGPGDAEPGALHAKANILLLRCADGWLALDMVQRPGRKRQPAREFLNGLRGNIPASVVLQ